LETTKTTTTVTKVLRGARYMFYVTVVVMPILAGLAWLFLQAPPETQLTSYVLLTAFALKDFILDGYDRFIGLFPPISDE